MAAESCPQQHVFLPQPMLIRRWGSLGRTDHPLTIVHASPSCKGRRTRVASTVMLSAQCSLPPARQSLGARASWPNGLTDREVEVLRLVSYGASIREVAEQLVISPKTAGKHIENIYVKINVSSRAAAALFALQNDLLHD